MQNFKQTFKKFVFFPFMTLSFCLSLLQVNGQTWQLNGITVVGNNGAGSGPNQLNLPTGISVDASGNIYIAESGNHRVTKWSPPSYNVGVTVAGNGIAGSNPNQLNTPYGIFVDGSENIYICDHENYRVQKWSPPYSTGVTVAGGNGPGSSANKLDKPWGIYVDNSANIYVSEINNQRVSKWSSPYISGIIVAGGNQAGSGAHQLDSPTGIMVDNSGNLYISDHNNNRIQKWSPSSTSGITVAGGNGSGSQASQLNSPSMVYVDNCGIYVSDRSNARIQRFPLPNVNGITIAGGNNAGSQANQLNTPQYIAFDSNYNLYVADYLNHRVQKFAYTTTTTPCYGVGLSEASTNPHFLIYPNPTKDVINFSVQANVLLTTLTGQIIADKEEVNMLDISDKPSGIYFITLTDNKGRLIQRGKIIKE